ncbi:hypothetical protein [Streptomyces syringium]|uniref:hypothetical protein n=1 Tax=Streptomyces syringium TaxID=76729 RepID=UPI0033C29D61
MDAHEAQRDLEEARLSYNVSVQPPLPRWAPPLCGLLIAAAVALAGLAPQGIWWRLAALAAAAVLAVLARAVVLAIRTRQGVRGLRGPARKAQAALATSALAVFVVSLNTPGEVRWMYVAMGVAAGIIVWVTLHKKTRS